MSTMTETPVEIPVITLLEPMPGLGDHTTFTLLSLDDIGAMYSMRVTGDPERLLILAAAPIFHPEFTPVLDDKTCADLNITDSADAAVFLVVTAGESLADSTVNLLAPLVINTKTGIGQQVVFNGPDKDLRAPLLT